VANTIRGQGELLETRGNTEPIGEVALRTANVEYGVERPVVAHNSNVPDLGAISLDCVVQVVGWRRKRQRKAVAFGQQ
jgi:hypothetical protein